MYHAEFDAYSVAIAKSNWWPGAYAAIAKSGDKAASVYFGQGTRRRARRSRRRRRRP